MGNHIQGKSLFSLLLTFTSNHTRTYTPVWISFFWRGMDESLGLARILEGDIFRLISFVWLELKSLSPQRKTNNLDTSKIIFVEFVQSIRMKGLLRELQENELMLFFSLFKRTVRETYKFDISNNVCTHEWLVYQLIHILIFTRNAIPWPVICNDGVITSYRFETQIPMFGYSGTERSINKALKFFWLLLYDHSIYSWLLYT